MNFHKTAAQSAAAINSSRQGRVLSPQPRPPVMTPVELRRIVAEMID